jgi:hypothetical protein
MTTARELAEQILARAREIAARKSAEHARDEATAANDDLPPRHRELRAMLLGMLLPPPRKGE